MQAQDLIVVSVVGTNGHTRHQTTVQATWQGDGTAIGADGQPSGGPALDVSSLSDAAAAPELDVEAYRQAAKAGGDALHNFMLAQAQRIAAWEQNQKGGSSEGRLARAVVDHLVKYHNFHREDGNWFVLKEDNLEVSSRKTETGRTIFMVSGSAVFGA
jgi:hypothetical protein